jgi:hypothetical protein
LSFLALAGAECSVSIGSDCVADADETALTYLFTRSSSYGNKKMMTLT